MTFYAEPDKELTEEEKLLAEVIGMSQRVPCGAQVCLGLNLESAIAAVDKLFTECKLPLKDELIGELTLWRAHAEQGLKFSQRCDHFMTLVIRSVDNASKRN